MEVHHHPKVEKRNFKEYLLEFLMIFLAVTLGFFAESIRENLVDRKMLESYMQQMCENLKADTSRCNHAILYNEKSSNEIDSFRHEIDMAANGKPNTNRMYYFFVKQPSSSGVLFKQGAIEQLKNSGNMRLIENKELVNEILEYYDRWVSSSSLSDHYLTEEGKTFSDNATNFFYAQYLDEGLKSDTSTFSYSEDSNADNYVHSILTRDPPLSLLNNDPVALKKLNNQLSSFEASLHSYDSFLRLDKNSGDSLLVHIRKEYGIE